MGKSEIDLNHLMNEVLPVVRQFDLDPKFFALTLHISKEKFGLLSQHFPGHHPRFISISRGNEWIIDLSPILEPGDYLDGSSLRPDTFGPETHKKKNPSKKK